MLLPPFKHFYKRIECSQEDGESSCFSTLVRIMVGGYTKEYEMSNTLRTLGFAALLAVSASAMMSSQASALSMTECSAKFAEAKAAAKASGGTVLKWNDFRKANCAADAAAVAPAPATPVVAPAPMKPMKPMKPAKATTAVAPVAPAAPAVAATAPAAGTFMQQCSAAWSAMKAANTVPAGMTFRDFQKGKCVAPAGTAAVAPAAPAAPAVAVAPMKPMKPIKVAPAEPTGTTLDTTAIATVDKNGKPRTEKQIAAIARIRECGNLWRADKAGGKLAADAKWPAYWHDCSVRLKAAGQ
jgi:hypothetical protein